MVCDFLAIYHLRIVPEFGEFAGLSGYEFLRYAARLPAYQGAVQALLISIDQSTSPASPRAAGEVEMVPATELAIRSHPALSDLIEFS